jgi:hypothetical protein
MTCVVVAGFESRGRLRFLHGRVAGSRFWLVALGRELWMRAGFAAMCFSGVIVESEAFDHRRSS